MLGFFFFSVEISMNSNECCPKKLTDRDLMKLAQEHSFIVFYGFIHLSSWLVNV